MKEELEKLVAAGKIERRHVDPLLALIQAGYCMHKGWGFGQVTTLDGILGRLTVNFVGKKGHSMDLAFAAETLKPIAKDHILARKATDLAGLKQEAALHHLDVVKTVLKSFNGRATTDQIQQILVPDVIGSDWKKWWEAARAEMKKDGHFQVPQKKTDPILYQDAEISLEQRLMADFRSAKGLKARVAVGAEIAKCAADLENREAVGAEVVGALNTELTAHLQTMPALALEGIFTRDDVRAVMSVPPQEGEPTEATIWAQNPRLHSFLEELPAAKHRRALESFKRSIADWGAQVVGILNSVSAKLCGEAAKMLQQEGKGPLLKDTLARLINQHGASSELLLWFGKDRSDAFADILGPEVFRAMLTAMERDAFNEKKSNRLHDFILADQTLLPELIESADIEIIKDLTRALQLSPSFDDMDKRSLLARIVKQYPVIQSLITGDSKKEDSTILVSWSSLERRKGEYDELVNKRIPANSRDIALARSYGDLRENAEYKFSKEQQKTLNRRKHELEADLGRARGTDFASARTDVVSPGTRVRVTDLDRNERETYTILGAWDGDPDRNVLSYLSPLAQAFVGHGVGESVEFGSDDAKRHFRVEAIEPAMPASVSATVMPAPTTTPVAPPSPPGMTIPSATAPNPAPADSAMAAPPAA
jgi:transcription elongation GreA/GreB family factor